MTTRIEQIKGMLAEAGEDAFLRYSLGMEYLSADQPDEAVKQFQTVIKLEPENLAAHVECGKALRAARRRDEARDMFTRALELAGRQGESHVEDYIRQQLNDV
ncbi:MAG: tetratricopeptide repeat protein, partial [Phycisphaerae bacterium]